MAVNYIGGSYPAPYYGGGLGSVFSTIFQRMSPIIRKLLKVGIKTGKKVMKSKEAQDIAKEAKASVIKSGINLSKDILSGKNAIQSTKDNLKILGNEITKKASDVLDTKEKQLDKSNAKKRATPKASAGKKRRAKKRKKIGGRLARMAPHTDIFSD